MFDGNMYWKAFVHPNFFSINFSGARCGEHKQTKWKKVFSLVSD